MIVNGKTIFDVATYWRVLVEKTIKGLTGPECVPVYYNFDYDKFIGIATLRFNENLAVYADIHLLADIKGFPAVGYVKDSNKIYCLSVGPCTNADPDIKILV